MSGIRRVGGGAARWLRGAVLGVGVLGNGTALGGTTAAAKGEADAGSPAPGTAKDAAAPGDSGSTSAEAPAASAPEEAPAEEAPPAFEGPVLLESATPAYPQAARDRGVQGDVVLLLTVGPDGAVRDAAVESSPDELLSLASLEAARRLRFRPAREHGEPVAVQLRYRFHFDLGIADQQDTAVPGSLHGVVLDPDGLPMPGATVRIASLDDPEAPERTVEVDARGGFWVRFLPSGRYRLAISHPATNTREVEIRIEAGQNLERSFTLYPAGEAELVVTYETQTWREVRRAPLEANTAAVTGSYELTRRDVETTPGSMEDVSRAVHALPGIVSDGDMLASFHARGGDADEVVFLLDRVPLSNPFHLAGFNSMFNPDMVSGVDFYAGAPPADVPAATSAVLSVHSWDGAPRQDGDDLDGAVDISASSMRALAMGPVGDRSSFALAARRSYLESYFQVLKWAQVIDTAFTAPEFSELSGRWAWRPDARNRLVFTALRAGDSIGIVDSSDESLVDVQGRFEMDNDLSLLSVDHRYEPREGVRVWSTTAWTRDHGWMLRDLGTRTRRETVAHRWFGRTDLDVRLGRHALATGVELSWRLVEVAGIVEDPRAEPRWTWAPLADYGRPTVGVDESIQFPETSAYVQDTWSGPVNLRAGLRATRAGLTDETLLSPRLGASLPLPTGTVPKVSWGIYHRTPSDPLRLDADIGNPDLGSERAEHLVVGLDQAFPLPGEDAGGLLRVEAYRILLDDLVVWPDDWRHADVNAANAGSGRNRGVDVLLAARAPRWAGTLTYSYLEAERTNPLATVFARDFAPAQDQRHTLGVAGELQVSPRWRLTARYSFHTGRPVSRVSANPDGETVALTCLNCDRLGPTRDLDLRAEWRRAMRSYRLTVYAEILNALNFKSDFAPIVDVSDGQRTDGMLYHLPARPFLGVRADF